MIFGVHSTEIIWCTEKCVLVNHTVHHHRTAICAQVGGWFSNCTWHVRHKIISLICSNSKFPFIAHSDEEMTPLQ